VSRALVICIGNELIADDAFGRAVFQKLGGRIKNKDVRLCFLSTGGLQILDELQSEDLLVVVDAVSFGAPAGTLHIIDWSNLNDAGGAPVTSHDVGIKEVLGICKVLYPEKMPAKAMLYGVEAQCLNELGLPMTKPVEDAVGKTVEAILKEVEFGVKADVAKQIY